MIRNSHKTVLMICLVIIQITCYSELEEKKVSLLKEITLRNRKDLGCIQPSIKANLEIPISIEGLIKGNEEYLKSGYYQIDSLISEIDVIVPKIENLTDSELYDIYNERPQTINKGSFNKKEPLTPGEQVRRNLLKLHFLITNLGQLTSTIGHYDDSLENKNDKTNIVLSHLNRQIQTINSIRLKNQFKDVISKTIKYFNANNVKIQSAYDFCLTKINSSDWKQNEKEEFIYYVEYYESQKK